MNAQDPNFSTLMLFASIIAYGILPAFAPARVILCGLWLLGSHPLIAIALAVLWLLKWVIWDFFVARLLVLAAAWDFAHPGFSDHRHLGNLFVTCGSNVEEVSVITPELRIVPLAFHAFMASIASASAS
jgi:hypothetical protein